MGARSAGSSHVVLLVAFFAALLTVGVPLPAQTSGTGALTGTVTDSSGAAIPGAVVTATDVGTGQSRTAATDATGNYDFSLLPAGVYRVTFSAQGFKTVEVRSVSVNVTEVPVLNQNLAVGSKSERITVSAAAETSSTPVNVNKASAQDLESSLGLAKAEAEAIVKYREKNGNFKTWHDVAAVPGVSAAEIEGMQKRITFE